jgi:hypothetical protein
MDLQSQHAVSSPQEGVFIPISPTEEPLEVQIVAVGDHLLTSIRNVLSAVPRRAPGPQALARTLGVDKVLASRVLKATRNKDPMSATHSMPGPDPLRRLVRAAARKGAAPELVADASRAIDSFEILIRDRIGDRSLLDAILSAWVPEARREFELRRKQSAFKAISQLKGVQADTMVATVILNPSRDGRHIDVVWINGLISVHRVRPGVGVKLSTRRMTPENAARRPVSLEGKPIEDIDSLELRDFCSDPMPRLQVHRVGEVVHYTLADDGFGPNSAVDIVFAEANISELARYITAEAAAGGRLAYFFAECVTPARILQFDVLVHEDLYPGPDPSLIIYDTSFEGVASVNNRSRDIDRMDMLESIEPLGTGLSRFRSPHVPRYQELMRHAFDKMGFDAARFRGYRCKIDYPVYGSQVAVTFKPETEPG